MPLPLAVAWTVVGIGVAAWAIRAMSARWLPSPPPRPDRDLTAAGLVALFVLMVAMVVGGVLVGATRPDADGAALTIRPVDLALPAAFNLLAALAGLRVARSRLGVDATVFGCTRARPLDLAFALGVFVALVPAYIGIGALNAKLNDELGLERHQRLVSALLTEGRIDPWAVLLIVAVVPVCEELLFRGVFQTALASVLRPWAAIAASATLFALAHDPQSWALIAAVGVGLGIVRHRTGSVLASTFFHATFNAVMLTQIVREAR